MSWEECNGHHIFAGVAVGGGWQALVAYINLFCYYIVGLPLGFLLGYKAKIGVEVNHHPLFTWEYSSSPSATLCTIENEDVFGSYMKKF